MGINSAASWFLRSARGLRVYLVSPQGMQEIRWGVLFNCPFLRSYPEPTESETLRIDMCIWKEK